MNRATLSSVLSDAVATLRPSACPGLLRIVAARDGGICRIRLPGGELTAAQASAIAGSSALHGSGVIELTNRANLQVRGVRSGHEAALSAALIGAGLGPIDPASAAADDVRNVMISPLAGRDPAALIDTRPICAELLALLQGETRFAALSPKFALMLDGGERLVRVDHPHDVWFAATATRDGVRFVFGLAGCAPRLQTGAAQHAAPALAAVLPSQVPALARALLLTFVDLADADATRMRDLLAVRAVDTILRHAQTYLDFPLTRDASLANWRGTAAADATLRLGAHRQHTPHLWHAGAQVPLGRLDAASLQRLAVLAQRQGNATLHVTPWQSVLLTDIAGHHVPAVLDEFDALGLARERAQPLARLIACTGSSGCAKGLADTKADALQLAERLPPDVDVHLSGCLRSCAAAHCAPYTLLAVAPGLYDLYRRDAQPGFGECVAHRLTIDQAASLLNQLARSAPDV
ncbi:precorrin-3B synthase [Paraburkholderia sp. PREW-6R]|uniref:precorrin-3B synthase n=1 Tax=Paraburkholderia sp. PREW-6R TaxID=3141544 RepID=UPI0031F549C8